MEFRNLTPFPAIAYSAMNATDREFHVVAIRITYDLVPAQRDSHGGASDPLHHLQLARQQTALCPADEYYGEVNLSSVKCESDFAPFKPKCDVIVVNGNAYAPGGTAQARFGCGLKVHDTLKVLSVTGPRQFKRGVLTGWALTEPAAVTTVPLRFEHAYGGTSLLPHPKDSSAPPLVNEVYMANPVGSGWAHPDYLKHTKVDQLAAPQIEAPDQLIKAFDKDYTPQGMGVVGRAWRGRIEQAGTYDELWKKERWPLLPSDFDFGYWNGAHRDLQIDYPPETAEIVLMNMTPSSTAAGSRLETRLPGHRAFVLARFKKGGMAPVETPIDTILIDPEAKQITLVYRTIVPLDYDVRVLEARFEIDPDKPLITFAEDAASAAPDTGGPRHV